MTNLNQLIESAVKNEVKKTSLIPVIWSSDLEIIPFTTELGKNYATIVNRRTVRLINYEFTSNEENEIKIISMEEFSSATKEKALEKAEKIISETKKRDRLILEQARLVLGEVKAEEEQAIQEQNSSFITENNDASDSEIQQEINKLKEDNEALRKENEELRKNQADLDYYSEKVKQIAELEKKIEQLEADISTYREELNRLNEQVNNNDILQEELKKEISDLGVKLEQKEREIRELRNERDKLVRQLTIYQEIINSVETKKKELEKLKSEYVEEALKSTFELKNKKNQKKEELESKLEKLLISQDQITRANDTSVVKFANDIKKEAREFLDRKLGFVRTDKLCEKQSEITKLEIKLGNMKKQEKLRELNQEFQAQVGNREKEIVDKAEEFLIVKKDFLFARQKTIEELQKCLNELEKSTNGKKCVAVGEMGNLISNTGEAVSTITFGIPKAIGEMILASNNFSKVKFSEKSSEQFQISLADEKLFQLNKVYGSLVDAINSNKKLAVSTTIDKILGLENKLEGEEIKLFNVKYKIYDILIKDGIWKERTLTPEKMEIAITSLNENLDELRSELVKEEKQFKEFLNNLQSQQIPQIIHNPPKI